MLFNSFAFLLAFLPLALLVYWLTDRYRPDQRLHVLLLLSVLFYGFWDWRFVALLVLSIGINWLLAETFHAYRRGVIIVLAIALNLIVLGVFKYTGFIATLLPTELQPDVLAVAATLTLPLGISFFTFHHVMYLVDLKAGKAPRYDLVRYGLYISFFPQVLSGPLVRWSEIMSQLDERPYLRPDAAERFARGLMLLTLGLSKKVFIADQLAPYVNGVFAAASRGTIVTVWEAWQATLGFTFQIYFDFSGYTDMALGIALMFGVVLPQNFAVPYRATSLREFWRRWHMTLSRFLRDYLYIPLGGNRHGLPMQLWALLATMALGGLWHGAGLTFVAWGILHGLGLCLVLLWHRAGWPMPAPLGFTLTFAFVVLTWVLFRAQSFDAALHIYQAMLGLAPPGGPAIIKSIVFAAAFAMIGPSTWTLVHMLPPRRSIAVAFAALLTLVLLGIADEQTYEFIYFRF